METKANKVVYYFHAPSWDDVNFKKRNAFMDECKRCGLHYILINVDSRKGADLSCEMHVRNVPVAVVVKNGKEIGRETGNHIHEIISKYC